MWVNIFCSYTFADTLDLPVEKNCSWSVSVRSSLPLLLKLLEAGYTLAHFVRRKFIKTVDILSLLGHIFYLKMIYLFIFVENCKKKCQKLRHLQLTV